jgi:hypothetical protein
MNRTLCIASVLAIGLGLGGCATTGGQSGSRASADDGDSIDQEKIVSVNKWARDRGYDVTWVNLPHKSKKLDSDD